VLIVLSTITLILPNYTLTTEGPLFSALQLAFVSVVTMILYGLFLYTQTVLHRDYFIADDEEDDGAPPTYPITMNAILLVVSLVTVVLLAKSFSFVVDAGGAAIGAPPAFTGIVVALLVLLPEGVAAFSAARHNKLQKSINLSLGSALATISLTIPAVALVATLLGQPLLLGLPPSETTLLIMTFAVSMLTFATGVTNILFGMVHMLVFAVFLLTVFAP
jgi:Ca2+:H+ antiporter